MSDQTIIDLDVLVPSDKKVLLGGTVYTVPGDMPMEIYLKVNRASQMEEESEADAINLMVDALADLFTWESRNKDNIDELHGNVRGVLETRGVRTITRMLSSVYKEDTPTPDEVKEENPPLADGTKTTTT